MVVTKMEKAGKESEASDAHQQGQLGMQVIFIWIIRSIKKFDKMN
jgi:hypothetical protein